MTKEYAVSVVDFQPVNVIAMTPGKARSKAWNMYCSAHPNTTFKQFLSLCKSVKETGAEFEEIMVDGEKALAIPGQSSSSNTVAFIRPGTDVVRYSHQLDVVWPEKEDDSAFYAELAAIAKSFMEKQEREFEKVLDDNLENLYES